MLLLRCLLGSVCYGGWFVTARPVLNDAKNALSMRVIFLRQSRNGVFVGFQHSDKHKVAMMMNVVAHRCAHARVPSRRVAACFTTPHTCTSPVVVVSLVLKRPVQFRRSVSHYWTHARQQPAHPLRRWQLLLQQPQQQLQQHTLQLTHHRRFASSSSSSRKGFRWGFSIPGLLALAAATAIAQISYDYM